MVQSNSSAKRDDQPEGSFRRLYTDLLLASDNLSPMLVRRWIAEWGDLNAPVLDGGTVLDRVLDEAMPEAEQLRLATELLAAGAKPRAGRLHPVLGKAMEEMRHERADEDRDRVGGGLSTAEAQRRLRNRE